MNFFYKIVRLLRKPFPEDDRSVYYRNSVILGIFVTLFLYIFEPFGIDILESNQFYICLGFGSMTILAAVIYELIVYQLLNVKGSGEHWTFGKWIFHNLMIVLLISLANFLFARLVFFGSVDWNLFPTMIYSTFMIGILPVTMLGAITLFTNEKKYQGIADEINRIKVPASGNAKHQKVSVFDIPTYRIKYIEALQNYAKIGYIDAQNDLKIQTERTTLKEILAKTEGSSIVRCHRSFLVNKDAIIDTKGNAQGLLLSLSDCDREIPVSRTLVPIFRQL